LKSGHKNEITAKKTNKRSSNKDRQADNLTWRCILLEKLTFSEHAQTRMAQRKLSATDVEYVVNHGVRYHNAGGLFRFLGKRNIPDKGWERLEGSVVLLDSDTETVVITVYRNRTEAAKDIRCKSKRNLH
jgi:hypothetical protein